MQENVYVVHGIFNYFKSEVYPPLEGKMRTHQWWVPVIGIFLCSDDADLLFEKETNKIRCDNSKYELLFISKFTLNKLIDHNDHDYIIKESSL